MLVGNTININKTKKIANESPLGILYKSITISLAHLYGLRFFKNVLISTTAFLHNLNHGACYSKFIHTSRDDSVYFYEDFLKAYDSQIRQRRGVYYTPPPVVSFITRAINDILKKDFGIEEGFADREQITVLDFATGTGTFLRDIIELILDEIPERSGKKDLIIKEHILKNLYGFEYLIAPYTIAHLKLSQFLKEKGYTLKNDERFEIYMTNTLEPLNPQSNLLLPALTKEAQEAQKIKDKKILVMPKE